MAPTPGCSPSSWSQTLRSPSLRSSPAPLTQLIQAGDPERALGAVRQGLRAVTGDYGLWELYLSIAAQVSPGALSRARSEAQAALGDDAPLG